jgi:lysophospholipase L1-like esterase
MDLNISLQDCTPAAAWHRLRTFISHGVLVTAAALAAFCLAFSPARPETAASAWISSWTASPQLPRRVIPASFSNRTIRQTLHLSIGGRKVRIRLSNEFGAKPLLIGAASVAVPERGADVVAASLRPLTFGGERSIIIPPGAPAISDPVEFNAAALTDVAVSLYLPVPTDLGTIHATGLQTTYVSTAGDFTAHSEFPAIDRFENRYFLTGVMVEPVSPARAIVAFGDSITDGSRSSINTNGSWPDVLARRLQQAGASVAVLNQGIAGNRVLSDGAGVNALARFERDALSEAGVSHVMILLGINDIGWSGTAIEPDGLVRTPDELIAGYKQLIERAHLRGIKVIGSPLMPFENALAGTPNQGYFTWEKEAKRLTINAWIRTSGAFDGLIDFDRIVADPAHPSAMAAAYDSGDHLHPNDEGYKAMGESIDLKLFQ